MVWFEAIVESAHVGTGKTETHKNYVDANDAFEALDKLQRSGGWKKGGGARTPSIKQLSPERAKLLEQGIAEMGFNVDEVKKTVFYGRRRDGSRFEI